MGAVLRRLGLGRLKNLEERLPVRRCERKNPGELIHLDTKKLGRIIRVGHRITGCRKGPRKRRTGWEALHVAIDDATRLAYTEVLPDEKKQTAIAFLSKTLAFFKANGVTPERIMTGNGRAPRGRGSPVREGDRSRSWRAARLGNWAMPEPRDKGSLGLLSDPGQALGLLFQNGLP